jgi:diguanylate cyclase (GGDEF)-like protein
MAEINIIAELGRTLTSTLNIDEAIHLIMKYMANLIAIENWSLILLDEETGRFYFEVAMEKDNREIKDLRFNTDEGIAGWVVKHKKMLIIEDVSEDERFTGHVDKLTGFKTKSIIATPLLVGGNAIGVIELINIEDIHSIRDSKLSILSILADFAAIAINNARNYQHINLLTITDDLTGLYNSRYLHQMLDEEFSRCIKEDKPVSLIFIDIDYLRRVNNAHGHLAGARAISEFGQVIREVMRPSDFGARYGGDEFVLILIDTLKSEALEIAHTLRQKIKDRHFLTSMGLDIRLTASFGVATFPHDVNSREEAIKLADRLMYEIKESTRDGIAST